MRKVLLAMMMTAVVALPAHAAVQNIKVGGELKSFYVHRDSLDLGTAVQNPIDVFASITKVNVTADLSDNVTVVTQLINEREWGDNVDGGTGDSDVQLDLAYVELREFLYSPLTVTVGRQNLQYGNSLIIGGPNDGSTGLGADLAFLGEKYGWDAIKLQFDYDPLTIDFFAAKDDAGETGFGLTGKDDDNDVYGINAGYELGDEMSTMVEAYFFSKISNSTEATANAEAANVYVPGLRVSTNPIEGLSFSGEFAWQYGDTGTVATTTTNNNNIDAWALDLRSSYALPMLEEYSPVLHLGYRHFSGDDDASDGENNNWDPMFEDQDVGRLFDTLFSLSNLDIFQVGVEATPIEDLTVAGTWYGLWLAEEFATAGYNAINGTSYFTTTDSELGHEFDIDLSYAYTEDVNFGVTAGWFVPGDVFTTENDNTANQVIGSVSVAF